MVVTKTFIITAAINIYITRAHIKSELEELSLESLILHHKTETSQSNSNVSNVSKVIFSVHIKHT